MKIIRQLVAIPLLSLILASSAAAAPQDLDKDLYFASMSGEPATIKALIAKGANPNFRQSGRPILAWVAQNGSEELVKTLIEGGAKVDDPDEGLGQTALMRAIDMQHPQVVQALLDAHANPSAADKDGKTALLFAIDSQKPQVVQALVDAGADVKKKLPEGNSLVLQAAQLGTEEGIEIVKILAKAGAEMNISNAAYTPLTYALSQENAALVQALLDAGADPNAPVEGGKLPIQEVLDNAELLTKLLKAKADPNADIGYDGTPLLQAVRDGNKEVVQALLEGGADPSRAGKDGVPPIKVAEQYGQTEIQELLARKGGDPLKWQGNAVAIEPVTAGGTTCTIVDAAKKQMEIHALLQAQVNAGKINSDIFRTFNDDTQEYGRLLTENPAEACNLLERLRKKYGV